MVASRAGSMTFGPVLRDVPHDPRMDEVGVVFSPPFVEGQIVRLKTGQAPQRVVRVFSPGERVRGGGSWQHSCWKIEAKYLSSFTIYEGQYKNDIRPANDYVLHETYPNHNIEESKKEKKVSAPKLYQTRDGKKFGTLLATNSEGRLVLEMKGSAGNVEVFSKDEIEEVRPYTVQLLNTTNNSKAHFEAVKGSVEKGDLILTPTAGIIRVLEVDTKQEPEGRLEGRRLQTEELPKVGG